MHQTKSNTNQVQLCGTCGSRMSEGACPRKGCSNTKNEARVPKWMQKSARRIELNEAR